jgi:hypothetical protein
MHSVRASLLKVQVAGKCAILLLKKYNSCEAQFFFRKKKRVLVPIMLLEQINSHSVGCIAILEQIYNWPLLSKGLFGFDYMDFVLKSDNHTKITSVGGPQKQTGPNDKYGWTYHTRFNS